MSEKNVNGIDPMIEKKFRFNLKKDEHIVWTGTSIDGYESSWIFSEKPASCFRIAGGHNDTYVYASVCACGRRNQFYCGGNFSGVRADCCKFIQKTEAEKGIFCGDQQAYTYIDMGTAFSGGTQRGY